MLVDKTEAVYMVLVAQIQRKQTENIAQREREHRSEGASLCWFEFSALKNNNNRKIANSFILILSHLSYFLPRKLFQ